MAKVRRHRLGHRRTGRPRNGEGGCQEAEGEGIYRDPIPARMLNEYVYCPRLFYYEFVEGVFRHNADTRRGEAAHTRVDRKRAGALPRPGARKKRGAADDANKSPGADGEENPPETIHSRSVSLGSEILGVTAKLDLVEVRKREEELFSDLQLCPVEYKVGSPKEDEEGLPTLWDTDKMQLGLQVLLLRENGYECDEGILYYRGTRQRVRLAMTAELERWIVDTAMEARRCAARPTIPPPLEDSPKCVRCSLAPVCLPDETRLLVEGAPEEGADPSSPGAGAPRRLIASGDEKRVVYLSTPGLQVGTRGEVLRVTKQQDLVEEIPIHDVLHLGLFGNVGLSTPAVRELCRREIPISWFSTGGWFYGRTHGHGLKNVVTRIAQFGAAADEAACLRLAKAFVRGKIRNQRTMLRRNHVEPDEGLLKRLARAADADTAEASSLQELMGIEGAAASLYFGNLSGMLKTGEEERAAGEDREGNGEGGAGDGGFDFQFEKRNRRPPRDPVNALLSLSYSLLAKDCSVAASAVGMDPYVGFFHQPRHGRPALALDVMEEFRPIVADSAVLQAVNNRVLGGGDFIRAGSAVNLTPEGRKRFLQVWERRMRQTAIHPVFGYKVSYRRAIELQFRLLARVLTGEIAEYVPFLTR
ncbi:MAG: CRISPR-associated endonuclease Cas1 [Akkermansiaceae bacterium]|nr:CRISPR-associated endonuclease Cas1 [Akkermansiaceae bacterium]